MNGVALRQGYEPFGSLLPGRNYSSGSYRYLFQGQEHDDELNDGVGTSYAFKYRMHDPRIGRFFSIDPLAAKYPWNSPYAFAENKVIQFIELEGLEIFLSRAQRAEYGGGFGNVGTFLYNSGVSLYNGFVDAFNYAGELDQIDNEQGTVFSVASRTKLAQDATTAATAVHSYVTTTSFDQFTSDAGDALSQVETWENITGGLMGGAATRGTRMLTSSALLSTRKSLASAFYRNAGFNAEKAAKHMAGIDFDRAVQTKTLQKGTVVQQWVGENGVGNYFTSVENGAARNLGIGDYDARTLRQFVLTEDVKVLQSTAGELNGYAGGGTQFFSDQLKNSIQEVTP